MGQRFFPFLLAAGVVLLDRATKWLIQSRLSAWDTLSVIPGYLNIVHSENPGIAFGLLANNSGAWRDIFLIGFSFSVLVGITIMLLKPGAIALHSALLRTGLGFVLGGAFGNLYDRVVRGTVTDFLEVHTGQHFFPDFNVADSAITVGACLLLLDMWRGKERNSQTADVSR